MARPKKNIDPETVRELASIDCSYEEMAAVLKCDPSTLTRRFAQAIKSGRDNGKASLKRKQYEVAMAGNVTMLIWLGKIRLGQKEEKDPVTIINGPSPSLDAAINKINDLIGVKAECSSPQNQPLTLEPSLGLLSQ